ncbi:hypothetical protein PFFCH_00859, partial [Plasmodium falciparum FCH/4]
MARKRKSPNENNHSARYVLENIAKVKYEEKKNVYRYENQLKGNLWKARFADALSRAFKIVRTGLSHFSELDYKKHTNNTKYSWDERHPCYGRNQDRFSEDQESECGNKIRDYKSENVGTSCAPPRRRHVCDQNLEFLDNVYTETTHDLLGNVLVTAKYEGASIVEKHPHKNNSEVCTALARSFADIGDIVRGRDMFKSNENVEKGLKIVFEKIYKSLTPKAKNHYKDDNGSGNYYKLREAWWTVNRDQVWEAITCKAPKDAHYFLKSSPDFKLFSNDYCGHKQGNVPTYFDYVPQYLRWFEEWAEEFCRKKKDKLNKVKEACRGKTDEKYCSHNACDCEKTIGKIRHFVWHQKCVECSIECHRYEYWINNQLTEFKKQKDKYQSEINGNISKQNNRNNNFNNIYYKEFYDKLRVNYGNIDKFLKLLNEEKECKNIGHDEKTYFNKSDDKVTFSRSKYCQVCPDCGVECTNGRCKKKAETDDNCGEQQNYNIPKGVDPTNINVLYSGDGHVDIVKRLSEFCRDSKKENGKNTEIWHCYYIGDKHNQCKMEKAVAENKHQTKIAPFDYFFDLWVTNLLRDTIDWKNELKNCINNKNTEKCNKECNDNCKCFQSWLNKKEDEWNKITGLLKNKNGTSQNYYNKLKSHFDNYFFLVINNVNQGEEKWKKLKEDLKKEIDFSKLKKSTGELGDSIKLLLDHENKNAVKCLKNNPIYLCPKAEPQKSDEKNQPQDTPPNPCVNGQNQKVGKITSVRDVAEGMQKQASVRGDINKLKGNIYLVKFKKGSNPSGLKSECEITKEHPNDSRRSRRRLGCRVVRRRIPRAQQVVKNGRDFVVGEEEEEEADNGGDQEVKKEEKEEEETPEEEAEVERPGPPVTPVPELPQPPATTTPGVKPPCDIVKEHFKDKHDNTGGIEKCYPKYYPRKIDYPGWNCTNETLVSGKGECMPPRRQKLCLINLQHLTEKTSDDLRKAFIKCAAVETCFLWHKYKEDKKNENPSKNLDEVVQKQLKDGTIPEEFKRQMFYTFGDYRDIFFDTDISKKQGPVKDAKNKIDELFPTTDPKNKTKRQEWWNEHKEAIWEGMLCALSYDTNEKTFKKEIHTNLIDAKNNNTYANVKFSGNQSTLEEFAKRPQFLRWYIEWSDEFCREREKLEKVVERDCEKDHDGCENNKKGDCFNACEAYKTYIKKKEIQYTTQKKKFDTEKNKEKKEKEYENYKDKEAHDYLKEKCFLHTCSCMEKVKNNTEYWNTPNKTYTNSNLEKRCECQPEHPPPVQPPQPPQPPQPKPAEEGGAGRSLGPRSKEDDEDKGEVEEKEETPAAEVQDGPGEVPAAPPPVPELPQPPAAPTTQNGVKPPCEIVQKLFTTPKSLDEACKQKYDGKYYGWKCVPTTSGGEKATISEGGDRAGPTRAKRAASGDTAGSDKDGAHGKSDATSGSICIPPRRRRLYIQKLHDWATKAVESTKSLSPPASTPASSEAAPVPSSHSRDDDLRNAFIESAAVETFFLWDRYKKEKKPQGGGAGGLLPINGTLENSGEETPENQLKRGDIPDDFLRQMFYTLGDYRDICIGKTPDGIDAVITSDQKEKDSTTKITVKEISENIKKAIEKILPKNDTSPRTPVPQPSDKTPESWWQKNGEHIWNGMIIALTYKEDTSGAKHTLKQNEGLKSALIKDGKPKDPKYEYKTVVLKEENSDPKNTKATASGDNNPPKLTQFVLRPTYFRYLEEWGQNFCKERKKRLEKIKGECKVNDNSHGKKESQKCSGYGENCEDQLKDNPSTLSDLLCRECGKHCRYYKKWIERKRTEFEKQKDRYETERQNAKKNPHITSDNEFCARVNTCSKAGDFLQKLGPCSKKDDDSAQDEIKFDDEGKTFGHETYCKPCSKFTVKCKENNHCDNSKEQECRSKTHIEANDIKNEGDSIGNVGMLVSDKNGGGFEGDLQQACGGAGIFKGIKENKWSCRNVCGYVVCKPEKVNGETTSGKKNDQIITIRALVTHWVHNFLEDYKKIKHKISDCMKNGKEYPCIKKCVEKWIKEKEKEWKEIKERFNDQYKSNGSDDDNVRSVLETFLIQIGSANYQNKVIELSKFDGSKGCCVEAHSQKKDGHKDAIECMINRLQDKIDKCKEDRKRSGEQTETECQKPPLVEDDDEPLEEEENPVDPPNICPSTPKVDKVKEEDECKATGTPSEPKEKEEEKKEEKVKGDEEEEAEEEEEEEEDEEDEEDEQSSDENHEDDSDSETEDEDQDELDPAVPLSPSESQPKRLPREFPSPELKNAMLFSTILWMVGIGFAAFTYFYLK